MRFPLPSLAGILLSCPLTAADFNAGWTGSIDQQWTNFSNWDIFKVPNNTGGDTYSAVIGGGAGLVFLNGSVTVENVALQAGASLSISDGYTLTLRNSLTNDGIITPEGNTGISRISITDSSGDGVVAVTGTGQIVLDHPSDRIGGSFSQTLSLEGGHTIRGHGNVGEGSVSLLNASTILADSPGNPLVIQPYITLTNTGFLRAESGGILRLLSATYHGNAGEFRIGDGSSIEMASITLNGGPIEVTDTNGLPSDNKLIITGNSTLNGTRNEAALTVNDGITLTLGTNDFTNNAIIDLLSSGGSSSLSFTGGGSASISLKGNGTVLLNHPSDTIRGSFSHTLTLESPHRIEGGGSLCAGSIQMINQSIITANNGSVPLVISPYANWTNDGGTLVVTGGATARLNSAAYTSTNGGSFLIGDDSTMELSGATIVNSTFGIDNLDADPLDHHLRIVGNSTFDESISDAVIRVDNGRTLTLRNDVFENRSQIHLDASGGNSSLSFTGGGDAEITLQGAGTVFLDSALDLITGSFSHLLRHASDHRIEGGGRLGVGSLQIANHGLIEANLPAVELQIAPYATMANDGGTVRSVNGSTITFSGASYSAPNGGIYEIGDNGLFRLGGGTWTDMTFDINDVDLDPGNNDLQIVSNTTFNGVTNEADLSVDDGRTLALSTGDFTNNEVITLNGASGVTSLNFSGLGDGVISLLGNGIVYLDNDLDRIIGSTAHTLIHGADHRIEGGGRLGAGTIYLVNHGTITANLPGTPLWIDPYASGGFVNDGGIVTAEAGTTIRLQSGKYSSQSGGQYRIGDDALFELEGVTLQDLTLAIDDNDSDLLNHDAEVISSSTFTRVVNDSRLTVNDGRSVTLFGGTFTNNAPIFLDSSGGSSRISINGTGVGAQISLEGTGTLFLDHPLDEISGAATHRLIHGPDHVIEGSGRVGAGTIYFTNHGRIEANRSGEELYIDPYASGEFLNDGGKLYATNGGILRLESGTYTTSNGGDYRVFDGSEVELRGATLTGMTLAAENTNGILADNHVLVASSSTMSDVVLETFTEVANAYVLTVSPGDLTNNGDLVLNGDGNAATTLSVIGTGDATTRLEGSGRLLLDHPNDRVGGGATLTLINGPDHRIEGAGSVGLGQLQVVNEGVIYADLNGQTMQFDCYAGIPMQNRGVLHATNGCIINIADPLNDIGGTIAADLSSSLLINGNATKTGGSLTVNGLFDPSGTTTLASSLLKGSGLVDSPLTATFTSVTPGNSTGTLTIGGNTTLGAGTSLQIEINSTADHDQFVVSGGNLQLSGGTLQLGYAGGPTDVLPTDVLTIVTSTGGVLNEFINITDGDRLQTSDGTASFQVNYLGNAITLTDFQYHLPPGANQPPVFTSFIESLTIDENTAPGTLLTTFFAYDPEGVFIEYSIDNASAPFSIGLYNGELRVNGPLNHEVQSSHTFNVSAYDQENYTSIEVTISLNDLIDTNEEITENLLTQVGGPFEGETDPAIIAYDADPDFDGRANIFELWRGTDPSVTDLPSPLILEPFNVSTEVRGSVIVEVDPVTDDLLLIQPEFSFDLTNWRTATSNRIQISEGGGIRTLRFFDTLPLQPESRFFLHFVAEADGEP